MPKKSSANTNQKRISAEHLAWLAQTREDEAKEKARQALLEGYRVHGHPNAKAAAVWFAHAVAEMGLAKRLFEAGAWSEATGRLSHARRYGDEAQKLLTAYGPQTEAALKGRRTRSESNMRQWEGYIPKWRADAEVVLAKAVKPPKSKSRKVGGASA